MQCKPKPVLCFCRFLPNLVALLWIFRTLYTFSWCQFLFLSHTMQERCSSYPFAFSGKTLDSQASQQSSFYRLFLNGQPYTVICQSHINRMWHSTVTLWGFKIAFCCLLPYFFFYLVQLLRRALALDKRMPPRATFQLCGIHKHRTMADFAPLFYLPEQLGNQPFQCFTALFVQNHTEYSDLAPSHLPERPGTLSESSIRNRAHTNTYTPTPRAASSDWLSISPS